MFNSRFVIDLEREMERIGVSPEGIEIMGKKGKFYRIRMDNIPLKGALLLKQEALAAGMECALPWCTASLTCDSTSAILFGTERQFEILIGKMKKQPFKGRHIAEDLDKCITNGKKIMTVHAGDYKISMDSFKIMGILNVTPDSFSDGGKYMDVDSAVERAREMVREGADIIDVGGESSRPFAEPVSEQEEMRRVLPVIEALEELKVPISVDTYKPRVAEEALKRGASIVNDIFGLRNEGMVDVVRDYDAAVVIMHMKGEPKNMQKNPSYEDVIGEIVQFLRRQADFAISKGVDENRIIVDPGIGFGKRVVDNLMILRSVESFRALGFPVLIGTSRKSFIGNILDVEVSERLMGTVSSNVIAYMNGASIFRVHDVKENVQALKIAEKVKGAFA